MFADNYKNYLRDRDTIQHMPPKLKILILLFCFMTCNSWTSVYLFVEDNSHTGSLKSLLKDNLKSSEIEVVGYTSKSLDVVFNQTNQLQTTMVWILRSGLDNTSIIFSHCGRDEKSTYTEELAKKFISVQSNPPRINIGWIPYKDLKHITSQCILLEIPAKADLAVLAEDLSTLFDSDLRPVELSTAKNFVAPQLPVTLQQSKKIPVDWNQFTNNELQASQQNLSETLSKLSYDPDEDLFLNSFAAPTSESLSKKSSAALTEFLTESDFLNSKIDAVGSAKPINFGPKSTKNLSIQKRNPTSSTVSPISTSDIANLTSPALIASKSLIPAEKSTNPLIKSNMQFSLSAQQVVTKSATKLFNLNWSQGDTKPNSEATTLPATTSEIDLEKQFNALYDLRPDFRQELIEKFRKESSKKTPEWIFEE